ncbi:MAG: hypothetical protein Q7S48_03700 [bacterium]|nr:hypothetical protein [bacterium]
MIQIGPVTIDFTPLLEAANRGPLYGMWYIFIHGGWVVIVYTLFIGFRDMWVLHLIRKYSSKWKWVLLSIDVPAENIQSPRAVENILAHLAGAHMGPDLIEKYFTGFSQEYFSLEIVSINGFVQFYIYTPVHLRDLVESSIYAQYPSAEISETEDYTGGVPSNYPDPNWDLWGTEFILVADQAYPLRTYEDFDDETAEEANFKDPMAALLETMSTMRNGEQLWLQITITPIEHRSWQEASFRLVEKLAGIPSEHETGWFGKLLSIPHAIAIAIIDAFMPGDPAHDQHAKDEMPSKMLYLTPGEREVIEKIEEKSAKIGFATKMRALYISKKEITNKARGRFGIIGAMKQFTTEDLNGLKPELHKVGTHAHYYFTELRKKWKRNRIIRAYKGRSNWRGMLPYVLNVEELATIWHFPVAEAVKAPLIRKAESKRAEPPHELPMEGSPHHGHGKRHAMGDHGPQGKGALPEELPEEEVPDNLPVG